MMPPGSSPVTVSWGLVLRCNLGSPSPDSLGRGGVRGCRKQRLTSQEVEGEEQFKKAGKRDGRGAGGKTRKTETASFWKHKV